MKQKQILVLAVFAVALMGGAVYLSESRKPALEAPVAGPLAPALKTRLNDLQQVMVQAAGGESVTLKRDGSSWGVQEKSGYPADFGKLRELLLKLAEARLLEPKTALPSSYPVLGVQDVEAEGATNVLLRVEADEPVLSVILGHNNKRGTGTFVRVVGETQSWLVDQNLAAEKTALGWIKRDLIDIAGNRLSAVAVQPSAGGEVLIEANRVGEGEFRLSNLPSGREPASAQVADATAGFLSNLRIEDVQAADTYLMPEGARTTTALFSTREGLRISIEIHSFESEHWAQFSADLDESVALTRIEGEQAREAMSHQQSVADAAAPDAGSDDPASPAANGIPESVTGEPDGGEAARAEPPLAVTDPEADRAARLAALNAELEAINQAVEGWVFKVQSFKAENLARAMDAYLKPKG